MGLRFPVSHSLIFEELNEEVGRIRDSWNNEYRLLSPREVEALRWKGKLVDVHEPEPTARPDTSAYEGETVAPTSSADRLRSILGEPSSGINPKDSFEMANSKFRLRPPIAPKPAPFEQNLRASHDFSAVPIPRVEPDNRKPPRRRGEDNRN